MSGERVRQIESRLKRKLKAYLEEEIEDIDLLQESMIEKLNRSMAIRSCLHCSILETYCEWRPCLVP